jgi:hypothetical protein
MVQVVGSAPRAMQQQLAAQPGLLKDLAGHLAHTHLSSSASGALQQSAAAGPSVAGFVTTHSSSPSSCPPVHTNNKHQQQHQAGSSRLAAGTGPSSSHQQLEAAAGALACLLDSCEGGVPPPSYQDLAPALHAALQQRLVCLPVLAESVLSHHTSHMVVDKQLLSLVMDSAEQGQRPSAADVLAALAPKVLQALEVSHPTHKLAHDRVTALLAGGTAAGAAFLAAAVQQEGGTLWQVPGMLEAACSGLRAACHEAAAMDGSPSSSNDSSHKATSEESPCLVDLPPAHTVCLQYLRGLVGVVLHLATHLGSHQSAKLAEVAGPMVPALAEALCLLLESLQLPGSFTHGHAQRPYHDAAWAALLALSECPGTAALVAALLQHQPGLLQALAASWDQLLDTKYCEEPADTAARLAVCLLLDGSIPGQEGRRQHQQLLVAAVGLWDRVWPEYWHGRGDRLLQLLDLPHGPKAVVGAPHLMDALCACYAWDTDDGLLDPEQQWECFALLLEAPDFLTWLVEGLRWGSETCLTAVQAVLGEVGSELTQALLAVPGLGDALAQCCSVAGSHLALDWFLGDALGRVELQEYLGQHPALLEALVARLLRKLDSDGYFWSCLMDADSDEWLVQQPALLDAVVHELVGSHSFYCWTGQVVERLLEASPSLVCESLLRQPSAMEGLLRVQGQRCQQQHPPQGTPADQQDWPRMLLGELAHPQLAPRALLRLPGLLAKGEAELSTGVFEAMHVVQSCMAPGGLPWGAELAATSSRGAAVLCAEGQLQALRQGVEEVQRATAAAAAGTRQLQEQRQAAMLAADLQAVAGHQLQRCRQHDSHGGPGAQQQGQQGAALQAAGRSSKRKRGCKAAAGQPTAAGAGSQRGAGGRVVTGKAVTATAAGDDPQASELQGAGAAPPAKRTRRQGVST